MAMKVINVGDVVGAADMNEFFVNTKYVAKPSGTTRSNTATPTIDPDLLLQVDANKSYMIEVMLLYDSNATANFKYRFNAPAGTVLYGTATFFSTATPGSLGVSVYDIPGIAYNTSVSCAGQDPFESAIRISGVLNTAGTAGGFSVAWSQDTSGGFSTALRQGSFMLVRRVS